MLTWIARDKNITFFSSANLRFDVTNKRNFSLVHAGMKMSVVCCALVILTGCTLGKAFMAGYTPPQTIADLLNEQYGLAGETPPKRLDQLVGGSGFDTTSNNGIPLELDVKSRNNTIISDENYRGQMPASQQSLEYSEPYAHQAPVQRFQPRFTYKSIQDYAAQLAMDLVKNANGLNNQAAIGVTSFVKLDYSLQNTTVLGNQLAEYSISEIQQFGLNVIDFKLMPAIQVTRNGDLAFSRDVMQLAKNKIMDHVLSATMIDKADGVFINARIIELQTNKVVSSASVLVPTFVIEKTQPQFVRYVAQ